MTRQRLKDILRWSSMLLLLVGLLGGRLGEILYAAPLGIVLLIVGGISSLLAMLHIFAALLFLAVTGLIGVVVSSRLPEVSASSSPQ